MKKASKNVALNKLLGLHDSRGKQGTFSRGKNVYNGVGHSPNPTGRNQSSAARMLLKQRSKLQGGK